MNAVDIIKGAREHLSDPNNWTKNAYCFKDRVCLEGALALAAGRVATAFSYERDDNNPLAEACHLILEHTKRPNGNSWYWLSVFNDDRETTHADVLMALDKTLADLGAL